MRNVSMRLMLSMFVVSLCAFALVSHADEAQVEPTTIETAFVMADGLAFEPNVETSYAAMHPSQRGIAASFPAVDPWLETTGMSCYYTCPNNMVLLCPGFWGLRASCVNGCCVYTPA